MGRYRKILVPVDGSESCRNAFRQACRVSKEYKSWLTAITVIPEYVDQFQSLSLKERAVSALKREGELILSSIKAIAVEEDVFIRVKLEEGMPEDIITAMAEDENYDLIVMGRRGRSNIERALVGSVTARVIGLSDKHVLVVPKNSVMGSKNILFATDGSRHSQSAAEEAVKFAEEHDSNVFAVSVVDVSDEFYAQAPEAVEKMVEKSRGILEAFREQAFKSNVKADIFIKEGETYKKILEVANAKQADVIFVGSHGRTGLKRILMGSVTEKIIGHTPCPVFVVKA